MNPSREVIYIHPYTPMLDPLTIPISLPALIKRIPVKVAGYSHKEIGDGQIKQAKVIIIDIHWHISLLGAAKLVKRIRRLNPQAKIIAGGITATEYAKLLTEQLDIDYVIRGDAEKPLPELVMKLLNGADKIDLVPNLVGKNGFQTPWSYALSQKDLDENDFYDLDFFPALRRRISSFHKRNRGWPVPMHPYIVTYRGCPRDCSFCAGARKEQYKLFRRQAVIRSPGRLRDDFSVLEKDPEIKFVNVLHDFITLLPEAYWRQALAKKINLNIGYYFSLQPAIGAVKLLLCSFRGGLVYFSADKKHATTQELGSPETTAAAIDLVKQAAAYEPLLVYNSFFMKKDKEYNSWVRYVYNKTKVPLVDVKLWFMIDFPQPASDGYAESKSFDSFMYYDEAAERFKLTAANYIEKIFAAVDYFAPGPIPIELRKLVIRLLHHTRWTMF